MIAARNLFGEIEKPKKKKRTDEIGFLPSKIYVEEFKRAYGHPPILNGSDHNRIIAAADGIQNLQVGIEPVLLFRKMCQNFFASSSTDNVNGHSSWELLDGKQRWLSEALV